MRIWSDARAVELAGREALLLSFRFFFRVGEVLMNCEAFIVGESLEAICASVFAWSVMLMVMVVNKGMRVGYFLGQVRKEAVRCSCRRESCCYN